MIWHAGKFRAVQRAVPLPPGQIRGANKKNRNGKNSFLHVHEALLVLPLLRRIFYRFVVCYVLRDLKSVDGRA